MRTKLAARDQLAAVLTREFGEPPFAVVEQADPALLDVEVDGVGRLKYPVTAGQARKLCALGTPARYGRGEQTLTDASVRDTWEVPRAAVHLSWSPRFDKVLDGMREELGLPGSATVRVELHSLLVYGPGQFFLPHQDSEKHDAMVGTLAVTLPSRHSGGELVITQGGRSQICSGSASRLALCAFYADCRHEVRPVTSGYRIAVTFNLLLAGGAPRASGADLVNEAARLLSGHFATRSSAHSWGKAPAHKRLVYLLDHEYTERGLNWNRLKGGDADRAALLRTAAEQAGCRIMLAVTKVQETWDVDPEESDYEGWDDEDEDEDWEDGEYADGDADDHDHDHDHDLNDLIERTTTLSCWIDPETGRGESISLEVSEDEVCSRTSTVDFAPYEQQYEGYMGNYGNTLDRWYRRAAVVVFPDSLAFANRAEAAPARAMRQVAERARSGDVAGARADAASLESFWTATVSPGPRAGVFGPALKAAHAVDDPAVAAMLLAAFRSEDLLAKHAAPLSRLAKRYGGAWLGGVLGSWSAGGQHDVYGHAPESRDWYSALPALCTGLTASGSDGAAAAGALLRAAWQRLVATAALRLESSPPSRRAAGLEEIGAPLAAVMAAAADPAATAMGDVIAAHLAGLGDEALPWLLSGLRSFSTVHGDSTVHSEASGDRLPAAVAANCGHRLTRRLARPARAANDWSIALPEGCSCPLCEALTEFLADPTLRTREWPLAEQSRRHVQSRIEAAELPVDHQTRRKGSPYTLILAKQDALFSGERAQRAEDEADLRWIITVWPSAAVASASASAT